MSKFIKTERRWVSKQPSASNVDEQPTGRCVNSLKSWTGKTRTTIIYDSVVDEFTRDGLFEKVKGKPNIAVIGFTTDGDVFGGFYSVAVTEQEEGFNDPNMFVFSFESHGRCETPQRFVVSEEVKGSVSVTFLKDDDWGFVALGVAGVGCFFLGNETHNSYCFGLSRTFEGLENTTLTGKTGHSWTGPYHHCTRLVAVQLS